MNLPIEGFRAPRPEDEPILWHRIVDKDYFRTLGIPLRQGRLFTDQDRRGAPWVAIINEAMARRFWPGQHPIGKHLGGGRVPLIEIIGVVADVRHMDSTKDPPVEVFFHYPQGNLEGPPRRATLAVRPDPGVYRDPMRLASAVSRAVAAVDKDQALTRTGTVLQTVSDRLAPKQLTAALIAVFAGLALALAAIGIYGVLSFSVAQRTHEIGVRMALGAERSEVLRMVVGEASLVALGGVLIGLAGAFALTRVIRSLLFGVSPTDPLVFAGVSVVLLAVAVLAAFLPARRAARVDPIEAIRYE
jgi:putative ABC transport system permease protein